VTGVQTCALPIWLTTSLLARRYAEDRPVIVKANVPVNFILTEIMAAEPDAKGVLLHFGLTDYLTAILRSDQHREWVRSVTREIAPAIEALTGPIGEARDAERAAALWLAQMRLFVAALDRWPGLVSLDAELLLSEPGACIAAARAHFRIASPPDAHARIAALSSSYAKNPEAAFDNAARMARRDAARKEIEDELILARAWIAARTATAPLPDRLANPLVGAGCALIG
jgi:hypothetical protein